MQSREKVVVWVSAAYLLLVGWLTLRPQAVVPVDQTRVQQVLDQLHRRGMAQSWDFNSAEFGANIAMFVPVGFLLALAVGMRFGWRWCWVAIGACLLLTLAIEGLQTQIPGRVPDVRDLIANSLGGLIGVVAAVPIGVISARRRAGARPEQPAPTATSRELSHR